LATCKADCSQYTKPIILSHGPKGEFELIHRRDGKTANLTRRHCIHTRLQTGLQTAVQGSSRFVMTADPANLGPGLDTAHIWATHLA
jgi:hypothetical protein